MTDDPTSIRPPPHLLPFARTAALVLVAIGAAVTVTGTFLPWLRSGEVLRNSFEVVATLERFRVIDNTLVHLLLGAWPMLGPALMAPVLLAAFRLWRTTSAVAVLLGVLNAAATVTALVYADGRGGMGVHPVVTGPFIVITGSAVLVIGAAVLLLSGRREAHVYLARPDRRYPGAR